MDATPSTDEERRLAALASRQVLDTATEPAFDDLAALARDLCRVPVAGVAFLDRDRNWFKAMSGSDVRESPRDLSFCRVVVEAAAPLAVPDLRRDPRFSDNPLVTGPAALRAYVGAPVLLDGQPLGTVCGFDTRARRFTAAQVDGIAALARLAAVALVARTVRGRPSLASRLEAAPPASPVPRLIDLDAPPASVAVGRWWRGTRPL